MTKKDQKWEKQLDAYLKGLSYDGQKLVFNILKTINQSREIRPGHPLRFQMPSKEEFMKNGVAPRQVRPVMLKLHELGIIYVGSAVTPDKEIYWEMDSLVSAEMNKKMGEEAAEILWFSPASLVHINEERTQQIINKTYTLLAKNNSNVKVALKLDENGRLYKIGDEKFEKVYSFRKIHGKWSKTLQCLKILNDNKGRSIHEKDLAKMVDMSSPKINKGMKKLFKRIVDTLELDIDLREVYSHSPNGFQLKITIDFDGFHF